LENLFIHSEEVKKELPEQSEKFVHIDKVVKAIMANGAETLNILKFCVQEGIADKLEVVMKDLQVCEKALNDFLDGKRKAFS
jgi:dynein heavy chain